MLDLLALFLFGGRFEEGGSHYVYTDVCTRVLTYS